MTKKLLLISLFLGTNVLAQSVPPPEQRAATDNAYLTDELRKILYFSQFPEKIGTKTMSTAFDADLVQIECNVAEKSVKECSYGNAKLFKPEDAKAQNLASDSSATERISLLNVHVGAAQDGTPLGGSALWQVFDKSICISNERVAELVSGRREAIFPPPMPYPPPAAGQEVEAAYFIYRGINNTYPKISLNTYSENGCVIRLDLNARIFW